MGEIEQYVPIAGFVAAVTIWLRQYWFQTRLTQEIVERLRSDNKSLRKENRRLVRENTVLRSRADEVVLGWLDAIPVEEDDED